MCRFGHRRVFFAGSAGILFAAVVAGVPSSAQAAENRPPRAPTGAVALDLENPRPGQAHGFRTASPRPGRTHGRRIEPRRTAGEVFLWVPRAVLFLPARFIEGVAHPVLVTSMVAEKYQLRTRIEDVFYNDARTFGAFPTAFIETGFGLNAGARLIHTNLAGHGESLQVRAGFGGLYRQRYEASIGTGRLLGPRYELQAGGGFRIIRSARFFGYGNADERGVAEGVPAQSPLERAGVESRYRRDEGTATVSARIDASRRVRLLLFEELAWRRFSRHRGGDPPDLADVYDPALVTGYERGQLRAYSQAAVAINTLSWARTHIPRPMPSRGWLVLLSTGIGVGFGDDPSAYVRGTADVQHFFNLWRGDRVLRVRLLVDAVDAPFDRIVFVDLPTLGGPELLRGYVRERFRGRVAGLSSAEYTWPIDRLLSGFLFVDVGRVWTQLPLAFTEPRVGFGGGLILRSRRAFKGRLQLASSIDGGFFLQVRLQPSWVIDDDV